MVHRFYPEATRKHVTGQLDERLVEPLTRRGILFNEQAQKVLFGFLQETRNEIHVTLLRTAGFITLKYSSTSLTRKQRRTD